MKTTNQSTNVDEKPAPYAPLKESLKITDFINLRRI